MAADAGQHVMQPTPYQAAINAANRIRLPRHVMDAYRWNPLKDVFIDDKGRLWFADTNLLRQELPAKPLSYGNRPQEFAPPETRRRRSNEQHAENRRVWEDERAEEYRRPVLVP